MSHSLKAAFLTTGVVYITNFMTCLAQGMAKGAAGVKVAEDLEFNKKVLGKTVPTDEKKLKVALAHS